MRHLIVLQSQSNLDDIVLASGDAGRFSSLLNGRKDHGGQRQRDGENGHEFDQIKSGSPIFCGNEHGPHSNEIWWRDSTANWKETPLNLRNRPLRIRRTFLRPRDGKDFEGCWG